MCCWQGCVRCNLKQREVDRRTHDLAAPGQEARDKQHSLLGLLSRQPLRCRLLPAMPVVR